MPTTPLDDFNAKLVTILTPLFPLLDAEPTLDPAFKAKMKVRPIDALLDVFSPIHAIVHDTVKYGNRISGQTTRKVPPDGPGGQHPPKQVVVDMRPEQEMEQDFPPAGRDFIRRIRLAGQFCILFAYDPPTFTKALTQSLADNIGFAARVIEKAIENRLDKAAEIIPGGEMLVDAKNAAKAKIKDLQKKLDKAMKDIPPNPNKVRDLTKQVADAQRELANLHGFTDAGRTGIGAVDAIMRRHEGVGVVWFAAAAEAVVTAAEGAGYISEGTGQAIMSAIQTADAIGKVVAGPLIAVALPSMIAGGGATVAAAGKAAKDKGAVKSDKSNDPGPAATVKSKAAAAQAHAASVETSTAQPGMSTGAKVGIAVVGVGVVAAIAKALGRK